VKLSWQLVLDKEPLDVQSNSYPDVIYDPEAILALIYTSGTTGRLSILPPIGGKRENGWGARRLVRVGSLDPKVRFPNFATFDQLTAISHSRAISVSPFVRP
jgi:hypothetical protein